MFPGTGVGISAPHPGSYLGAISQVWLCSRPEKVIAVVGHGGLFTLILGHHLKNCGHEWRTMQMDERPETELV